jgi:hypothetical protein
VCAGVRVNNFVFNSLITIKAILSIQEVDKLRPKDATLPSTKDSVHEKRLNEHMQIKLCKQKEQRQPIFLFHKHETTTTRGVMWLKKVDLSHYNNNKPLSILYHALTMVYFEPKSLIRAKIRDSLAALVQECL